MIKGEPSESIMILKEKFNEIKRNISLIEQKQSDFFSNSTKLYTNFRQVKANEKIPRPSSVSRNYDRSSTINSNESINARTIKTLEQDKKQLLEAVKSITKERDKWKSEYTKLEKLYSEKLVSHLEENLELKSRLETLEKTTKSRPMSCMRGSGSPKHKHVAFSKELVQVLHIKKDEWPSSIEKQKRERHPSPSAHSFNRESLYRPSKRTEELYRSPFLKLSSDYRCHTEKELYRKLEYSRGDKLGDELMSKYCPTTKASQQIGPYRDISPYLRIMNLH